MKGWEGGESVETLGDRFRSLETERPAKERHC